jgi:serine/threonine-protein kinase
MPPDQVVRIVTAVASALDYAHNKGLLHRDVKPANIILANPDDEGEQRVLLTDFGIARDVNDISGLTTTNMTVGTMAYSAPEQLMGEDIDGRADEYALAATAYHLLTGSQLYPHSNPAVVISRHLNSPPPAMADIRPDLAALDPVLASALAKDPDDRFQRCADFARALADQNGSRSSAVSAIAPTQSAPVKQQPTHNTDTTATAEPGGTASSFRLWLLGFAAAVLVVGVGVVFTWHPWSRETRPTNVATNTATPVAPSATSTVTSTTPSPEVFPAANIDSVLLTPSEITAITGGKFEGYPSGPVAHQ